ncbi:hypothetical protein FHX79_113606 [Streptomyces cavourensis]|nr:hypothetical protein FHX79_113606 [Streptomyces cavourensis]
MAVVRALAAGKAVTVAPVNTTLPPKRLPICSASAG